MRRLAFLRPKGKKTVNLGLMNKFFRAFCQLLSAKGRRQRRHDRLFREGKWDHLGSSEEALRSQTLANFHRHSNPGGKILELGSGQGHFLNHLKNEDFSTYLGIDASEFALNQENFKRPGVQTQQADIYDFIPPEKVDAIVYNEVLYYLRSPLKVIERYDQYLSPEGRHLISIFYQHQDLVNEIRQTLPVVEEKVIDQGSGKKWHCLMIKKVLTLPYLMSATLLEGGVLDLWVLDAGIIV